MTNIEILNTWGWRSFFADQLQDDESPLNAARVVRQDVNRYHLVTAQGPRYGVLRGRARLEATSRADLPTVGDWVICANANATDTDTLAIERHLDRYSKFSRKEAGDRLEQQVVAANIDTVFIVTGLDDNFNPARVERYLLLAWNSGANPVIILSKADLCEDLDACTGAIEAVAMGTPVHVTSAVDGDGLEQLRQYLRPGETVALLGSSGVGKSTIINALLGYERFQTGEVREADSKGRHTTTYRELCEVPGGGLLMDTPGMREIQLWSDDEAFASGFEDIEALALACRFTDCQHESEPGCAIKAAIESGELTVARLDSYRKFQRELEHFASRQDPAVLAQKRAERRQLAKFIRKRPDKRD